MNSDPGTPPPERPPPFTNLQAIIDQLNRTVQDRISCAHDVLRPGASEGAVVLGILECARCGLIQEARRTRPRPLPPAPEPQTTDET